MDSLNGFFALGSLIALGAIGYVLVRKQRDDSTPGVIRESRRTTPYYRSGERRLARASATTSSTASVSSLRTRDSDNDWAPAASVLSPADLYSPEACSCPGDSVSDSCSSSDDGGGCCCD